jgi:hypothetical protein
MNAPELAGLDLCCWRGRVHDQGGWRVIPGVMMVGVRNRNGDDEVFDPKARRALAPRLDGGVVFWTHDLPRGRPMGTVAGCKEVGNGIRGALVLAADHLMTPAVVRAALRSPGSLAMSIVAPVVKRNGPTAPPRSSTSGSTTATSSAVRSTSCRVARAVARCSTKPLLPGAVSLRWPWSNRSTSAGVICP